MINPVITHCNYWVFCKTFCDGKGIMHGFTKVANSAFYPSPSLSPLAFYPSTLTFLSLFTFSLTFHSSTHFTLSLFTLQLPLSNLSFSPFNSHFPLSLFTIQLFTFHPLTLTFSSCFSPFPLYYNKGITMHFQKTKLLDTIRISNFMYLCLM